MDLSLQLHPNPSFPTCIFSVVVLASSVLCLIYNLCSAAETQYHIYSPFYISCPLRVGEYFPFSARLIHFSGKGLQHSRFSLSTVFPHLVASIHPHKFQRQMKIRVMKHRCNPDPASRSEPFVMAMTLALSSKAARNWSSGGAPAHICAHRHGLG